jgi:ATP-dependent Clp protease ATP-binding subunit ClpB
VFHRLEREQIREIVEIQMLQFGQRLARRELTLELTPAAKDLLAEVGWDPQYGARPLKRAIRKLVEDPLAKRVLAGEFPPGTHIVADRSGDELTFRARVPN